ncbi:adenylyltransferase/cytidyltransferase family protein [Mucilaginibacter sp. AW1-3]
MMGNGVNNRFYTRMQQLGYDEHGISRIITRYAEPHRFYHTFTHIEELLNQLEAKQFYDNDVLFLAAVYHDIVYDPTRNDNEQLSADEFEKDAAIYLKPIDNGIIDEVKQVILDTQTHSPATELSAVFCEMDMSVLKRPFAGLIAYEEQVFKEFQFYDYKAYKAGRLDFLTKVQSELGIDLQNLIAYVQTREPKIAVYPGSFNPFHKGHLNILEKAEKIFDKVIIARGVNPEKENNTQDALPGVLRYRQQTEYKSLLTDFVAGLGYPVTIIRGLRNSTDLQYELNQYRYLQDLTNDGINIVSIFCDREFEHISSTAIRQLKKFDKEGDYLVN